MAPGAHKGDVASERAGRSVAEQRVRGLRGVDAQVQEGALSSRGAREVGSKSALGVIRTARGGGEECPQSLKDQARAR